MFELNNDLDIKIAKVNEATVVVVDNFYKKPDEVRELALSLGTSDDPSKTGGLPGIRSFYYTSEVREKLYDIYYELCLDNNIWQRDRLLSIPQWYDEWDKSGFLCNIVNDSTLLKSPLGIIPHQDRYSGEPEGPTCQFGSVIYLNTPEECAGGTNLFSYKGMMSLPCSVGQFMDKPEGFDDEVSETSQIFPYIHRWINGDREWKVEHRFDMVYNRCIVYESDVLHSPDIDTGMFTDYDRVNQVMFL